jgi:N-acetylmuramoyl-L-alanine amidase
MLFKKYFRSFKILVLVLSSCLACVPEGYQKTNKSYKKQAKQLAKILSKTPVQDSLNAPKAKDWVGTTNFGLRKPNFVIIHHTAQKGCDQTLKTFTLPKTQVSAHYVVCEDGTVHHMLNDYLRAWHAGSGGWGNVTDVNSLSVGIELDNDGAEPFKVEQMESLYKLLTYLKKTHGIPKANFIGHADIAPTRKNDPSVYFDWKTLSDKGFGTWFSDTTKIKVPTNFNVMQAYRIIGYQSRDSVALTQTFKRKYLQKDKSSSLSASDKKVLFSLMQEALK